MVPSKLIRVTIDTMDPYVKVLEYGQIYDRELTDMESRELIELETSLKEFRDFDTAEALKDEQRKESMTKKQRLEQLKAIQGKHINWIEQDTNQLDSLMVIMRSNYVPVYVENIPSTFIDRVLDPNIIVNVVGGVPVQHIEDPEKIVLDSPVTVVKDEQVFMVQEAIRRIGVDPKMSANQGEPWLASSPNEGNGLIYVSRDYPGSGQTSLAGVVYAWPVKFMKDDWGPVNTSLKEIFGKKLDWTRDGKWSHWTVKF